MDAALTVLLGGAALHRLQGASLATPAGTEARGAATFAGSAACSGCHADAARLWRGSQHAGAMQHANDGPVLGDFNDARFTSFGVTSRFFRQDGRYLVETDGPDGKLATFEVRRGRVAEAAYRAAQGLSPHDAPAMINLADLDRGLGRDDGERPPRDALVGSPRDAGLHHALGLTLIRLRPRDEALGEMQRAAALSPDQGRYADVHAVGLHAAGQSGEAMAVLNEAVRRRPTNRGTLSALIRFSRDAGDLALALDYAEQPLRVTQPGPRLTLPFEGLRRTINRSNSREHAGFLIVKRSPCSQAGTIRAVKTATLVPRDQAGSWSRHSVMSAGIRNRPMTPSGTSRVCCGVPPVRIAMSARPAPAARCLCR